MYSGDSDFVFDADEYIAWLKKGEEEESAKEKSEEREDGEDKVKEKSEQAENADE